jgi:nitrile hydratase accessory protein
VERISSRPQPETRSRVDSLVDVLPFGDRIPRRSGDVAFDHSWEIRAFSMTVALHEELGFPWEEFQRALIEAIRTWESQQSDLDQWSYYERWMAALEQLARSKGWATRDEVDARAAEILALPANYMHQHAVREPVAVVAGGDR